VSRKVSLNTNDGVSQIGTTILESNFPATPQVLIWKGRTFVPGTLYGQESYNEATHVKLSDDAVSTSTTGQDESCTGRCPAELPQSAAPTPQCIKT
jgi:hypothetical protein